MTREETIKAANIMLAWAKGTPIQSLCRGEWIDINTDNYEWWFGYDTKDYRIKPQPTYRPFKSADEVMEAIKAHGDWVKDGESYRRIDKVTELDCKLSIKLSGMNDWGINELPRIEQMCFLDGTPFGVKEE